MKIEKWLIYTDWYLYVQIDKIFSYWEYWYNEKIKELWIKTKAKIIKYKKSTSNDFDTLWFWLINYMKLNIFKENFNLTK